MTSYLTTKQFFYQKEMEDDSENVINLIFPDGIPDNLGSNPEFHAYLAKLGSFRVEELVKEPDRLSEEKASVLEQTQDLAFSNYKTFIQTAECSRAIFQQFKETENCLDGLLGKLPNFVEECHTFGKEAGGLGKKRRACSTTLSRSTTLLELLELPQLMEVCVSGQHYEEALQLSQYARRLERRHGEIPAIKGIIKDTQIAWRSLLQHLLSQLRTELALPKCLLIVGLLRRMSVFTESELRLKFLQARDVWLKSLLDNLSQQNPSEHLIKTVELSRQHLFAIITQYRAAFSDDPTGTTSSTESAILHGWITEKINQFLITLQNDLSQMNENEPIDSILNQCMYFGLSLARVGADFRALMSPIFINIITRNFDILIRKATKEFEMQMEKFNFEKILLNLNDNEPQQSSGNLQLPSSLLQFQPLALYCNAILNAFNILRLCSPLAIAGVITNTLQNSLQQSSKVILLRCRQEQHSFTSEERRGVQRLCSCFADDLVPHIQRCLSTIFPANILASHLAITTQQLQKAGISFINKTEIIDPISHLLPVQLEPIYLLPETKQEEEIVDTETDNNKKEISEAMNDTEDTVVSIPLEQEQQLKDDSLVENINNLTVTDNNQ